MKYIGLISSDARGKLGGTASQRTRAGLHLRPHVRNCDKASPAQFAQRNLMGSISSAWRALTPAQRQGWNELASTTHQTDNLGRVHTMTGINLYRKLRANAEVAHLDNITNPPGPPPTIPGFKSLLLILQEGEGVIFPGGYVYDIGTNSAQWSIIFQASKIQSTGQPHTPTRGWRYVRTSISNNLTLENYVAYYLSAFGQPPKTGIGFIRGKVFDRFSGWSGPWFVASLRYSP